MGRAGLWQVAALADPFLEPLSVIPSGVAHSAQLRTCRGSPLPLGWMVNSSPTRGTPMAGDSGGVFRR